LKVEIRIKTKNGIEDIIKQKHGKTDRGKNVPTLEPIGNKERCLRLSFVFGVGDQCSYRGANCLHSNSTSCSS